MARRVSMAGVNVKRVWGRSRLCAMDHIKVSLSSGGMLVEAARKCKGKR